MNRWGLALSGGGFRATLYHLGVIRCLRDAGVLPKITHLTTVSGGSILGAHLVLNWDRYCGTPAQFQEAADEIIRFAQLDVRNRIVRRFPWLALANKARSMLLLGSRRQWTRAGMLEHYYERFLYGDTPLAQLPTVPRLHILATNLSEGCLCSFNQQGLLMQRRVAGRRDSFRRVSAGLATVPMAVAVSSCFPGFFPPLELTGWDIGEDVAEFSRQAFTDGGVYDNLGLRMFRHLEQAGMQHAAPLCRDDFLALEDTLSALQAAEELPEDSPLGRLRKLLNLYISPSDAAGERFATAMIRGLWEVIRSEKLYRDPVLGQVELEETAAQSMRSYVQAAGRDPDMGDRLWLNRMLVEAALRQVVGRPCLRTSRHDFAGILVSDAGGKFKVSRNARGGGLVRTALRSSDILMDRVWQLESEVFAHTPGVVFIPIFDVVDPAGDPQVLAPEVQRRVARIRTDLDYFSDLEVSTLVQHGYGVARQICRDHTGLLDAEVPSCPPWDPLASTAADAPREPQSSWLQDARRLRDSSKRKILSTLFSWRDWPSYVWLLLLACVTCGSISFVLQRSERLRQQETILSAVAQLNPNYQKIVELLQRQPVLDFKPLEYEQVATLEKPDLSGFEVCSDSRVFDLRGWSDPVAGTPAVGYSRTRVRRLPGQGSNVEVRLQRDLALKEYLLACTSARLDPRLYRQELGGGLYRWELRLDYSHVPLNSYADIDLQVILPTEMARAFTDEGCFNFAVGTKTGLLQVWLLMPVGREYDLFEVSSHPIGHPELSEVVVPAAMVRVALDSVATFRLINPEPQRRYECRWTWGQPVEVP